MPLTTLLASCDDSTGASGVIEQTVMLHLIVVTVDLRNANLPLVMSTPMASHEQKNHVVLPFNCFKECIGAIDDAVASM